MISSQLLYVHFIWALLKVFLISLKLFELISAFLYITRSTINIAHREFLHRKAFTQIHLHKPCSCYIEVFLKRYPGHRLRNHLRLSEEHRWGEKGDATFPGGITEGPGWSCECDMCYVGKCWKKQNRIPGWWFGTSFIFPYIGNNHPNWLIFLEWDETTNQIPSSSENWSEVVLQAIMTSWSSMVKMIFRLKHLLVGGLEHILVSE